MLIHDEEIGGSWLVGNDYRGIKVDIGGTAGIFELLGVCVLTKCGEQANFRAEKSEIVCNITSDSAGRQADSAGVGVCGDELFIGNAGNVYVGAANDYDIRRLAENVATSEDCSLAGKITNMYRN